MAIADILRTAADRVWPLLPPGLLFNDADLAMLTVLLQERPVVATKLMLLRLIDKIDTQLKDQIQ